MPDTLYTDDYCAIRSKAYTYNKLDNVCQKNKLKGITKKVTKILKLDDKMSRLGPFKERKDCNEKVDKYFLGKKS